MKKLTTIISAILLVLCFSQCRRELQTVIPNVTKSHSITLDVNNISRADVTVSSGTDFGKVTFKDGDSIFVAYNGVYVGGLYYDGAKFKGDIEVSSVGKNLYFYFLGNMPHNKLEKGVTSSISVDMSDQSETGVPSGGITELPVISCGVSTTVFTGGGNYSATLANHCAILEFHITKHHEAGTNDLYIAGLKNKVVFNLGVTDYLANATYSQDNGGTINVGTVTGKKWLVLLPQDGDAGSMAYTIKGTTTYVGTRDPLPEIVANGYSTAAIDVNVNTSLPEGALPGIFSVSPSKRVFFSQGNLQYNKSTGKFSFMTNQYDRVETKEQNVGTDYASQPIVSLFGWGTSGFPYGSECYMPYRTKQGDSRYGPSGDSGLTGEAEWGHNEIENGGNTADWWRTLTKDEWVWLIGPQSSPVPGTNCRTSSTVNGITNARFTLATINNDIRGLLIFPDQYTAGTPIGVTWGVINGISGDYEYKTKCTSDGWNNLQTAGCVFLPEAYWRGNEKVATYYGRYWSSTAVEESNKYSYYLAFSGKAVNSALNNAGRSNGYSVRLVYDVK